MRKARKSQVSKARSALQYRLQEVAQAKSRLESATALLQEATAREVELVEAAAREKTRELQSAQNRLINRNAAQAGTIACLSRCVEDAEKATVKWRTAALVLLVTTVVAGCLNFL